MPSLKPVKSLFDLSLCSSRDLVISAAKNIEKIYPSASGLSYDVPGCSDAVLPMQGHLRDLLPATVYESLFQAVTEKASCRESDIVDLRIVFSTFICDNVSLKKLSLVYRWFTEYGSGTWLWTDDEGRILKNERHVEFWLNQIPKLVNLVELNLRKVTNGKLVLAFIRTCTELESITLCHFDLSSDTRLSVYQTLSSCTKLQKFDRPLNKTCVEEMMTTLDVAKKWTIRNLFLDVCTAEQVTFLMNLCPNIVDLALEFEPGDNEETMQILASCPHKFYKLTVDYYEDSPMAFGNLLSCKGIHIRDLTLFCCDFEHPLEILFHVSETCRNLIALVLDTITHWEPEDQAGFDHVISFPNLERLVVAGRRLCLIEMAKRCLANAPNVTSLELELWPYEAETEEELIQLFTANQRTKQLTYLQITCYEELLSTNLSSKIFEWCTNLKSFSVGHLDAEAKRFFKKAKEEIKLKNLDISLDFF